MIRTDEKQKDELAAYKGKWANFHVLVGRTKLGGKRYDSADAARQVIEQGIAGFDSRWGEGQARATGYLFTIQIPVES